MIFILNIRWPEQSFYISAKDRYAPDFSEVERIILTEKIEEFFFVIIFIKAALFFSVIFIHPVTCLPQFTLLRENFSEVERIILTEKIEEFFFVEDIYSKPQNLSQ